MSDTDVSSASHSLRVINDAFREQSAGLSFKAVANELKKRGFIEPTLGDGKMRRAWFLLEGYDIVGEHRNNYYFPE